MNKIIKIKKNRRIYNKKMKIKNVKMLMLMMII